MPPDDKDKLMDRDLKFSLMIRNFATAAKDFAQASMDTSVITAIGKKMNKLIENSFDPREWEDVEKEIEKEDEEQEKRDEKAMKEDMAVEQSSAKAEKRQEDGEGTDKTTTET